MDIKPQLDKLRDKPEQQREKLERAYSTLNKKNCHIGTSHQSYKATKLYYK